MKNIYVRRARISEKKFREIVKYFVHDLQANQISQLTGLSRNSINAYFKAMRFSIVCRYTQYTTYNTIQTQPLQLFVIQVNHNNTITLDPIPAHIAPELFKAVEEKNSTYIKTVLSTHYCAIINYTYKQYQYFCEHNSLNQNEKICQSFWNYTNSRLTKFRGLSAKHTFIHLKECEFRYNYRNTDMYKLLLTHFKQNPLHLHIE
jgi:transposase-like protein